MNIMRNKDTAIDVKNLSKVYRIGLKEDIQDNLARTFVEFLKAPYKMIQDLPWEAV